MTPLLPNNQPWPTEAYIRRERRKLDAMPEGQAKDEYPDPGREPDLRWLPTDVLIVDHTYQRSIATPRSQRLIAKIAAQFHWSRFGALLVTRRDDVSAQAYAVLDGQHRLEGARRRGIDKVPCVIIEAPSRADEARAFVGANTDRVAMHPFALHYALVSACDPLAVEIQRVCREGGCEIVRFPIPANKQKPGQTLAIGAITHSIKTHGSDQTIAALKCLQSVYHDQAGRLRAAPIRAVTSLLSEGVAPEAIRKALATREPEQIARDVYAWGRDAQCAEWQAYRAVLRAYVGGQRPEHQKKAIATEIREMIEGASETMAQEVRRRCERCGAIFATRKVSQTRCGRCGP